MVSDTLYTTSKFLETGILLRNSKRAYFWILTCFSRCTLTVEASNPVNACGSIETSRTCAVVDVFRAIWTCPTIHANTGISSVAIRASSPILTNGGSEWTFVNVLFAKMTGVSRWTLTCVGVDPIYAFSTVHTFMTGTVVYVLLAIRTTESWKSDI